MKEYLKNLLFFTGVISIVNIFTPMMLEFVDNTIKIHTVSILGTILQIGIILIVIIDIFYLFKRKDNNTILSYMTLTLSTSAFLLLEYAFISDIYEIYYVWNHSTSTLPIIYKIVAIWAGQSGSILTWMFFNNIIIFFFRIKNSDKNDTIFIRSVIISLVISLVFSLIVLVSNPYTIDIPSFNLDGNGLNATLQSPFMIWHPLFIFISYAVFLIPFVIVVSQFFSSNLELQNLYQKKFQDFSMKFGWLVITVGIGLGSYWANVTQNWGNVYWSWDPVESVTLIPWFLCTAYFHVKAIKNQKSNFKKINVVLIFGSIIFATLITRGGGLTSLHAFTGTVDLVLYAIFIGGIILISSLYIVYGLLNIILEEYKNTKLLFDYLSYLFLFLACTVTTLGLVFPPFSFVLSQFFSFQQIFINAGYFELGNLIVMSGLAISLIYCSLIGHYKLKWITFGIFSLFFINIVISVGFYLGSSLWINPTISLFILSIIGSSWDFIKNLGKRKGLRNFFKINGKRIIHIGISFILVGTVSNSIRVQDWIYFTGFFIMVFGILPSILMSFFTQKNNEKISQKVEH